MSVKLIGQALRVLESYRLNQEVVTARCDAVQKTSTNHYWSCGPPTFLTVPNPQPSKDPPT